MILNYKGKGQTAVPEPRCQPRANTRAAPKIHKRLMLVLVVCCVLYIRLFVVAESCSVAEPYGRTDGRTGTPDCDVQFSQTRDTGNNRHTF